MTDPIAGVVFDLDGTLADSRSDIAGAANHALAHHGYRTLSEEQIGKFVGDGARNLILRAAGLDRGSPQVGAILSTFLDFYAAHACEQTVLMPGAREALTALEGLPLAVLTNKPRAATNAVLEGLRIAGCFRSVIAGDDLPYLKPDPALLREVAERLRVPVSALAMVGDGPQDVLCGRNAGAFTVGILGGIADPQSLRDAHPDRLLASLHELPRALQSLQAAPDA